MKTFSVALLCIAMLTACAKSGGEIPGSSTPTLNPTCYLNGEVFTIRTGIAFSGYSVTSGSEIDTFETDGTFVAQTSESASGYFFGTWTLSGLSLVISWTPPLSEAGSIVHHEYFIISEEYNCADITWQLTGQN